jgi:endonuclease III
MPVRRTKKKSQPKPQQKREGLPEKRRRAQKVLRRLRKEFPASGTALSHQDPFQLLVATILSAQCTDERVNMVTPGLFARYPDAVAFALADPQALEAEIRSTGFFRMKAKNIMGCSKALVERHSGIVPRTLEELVLLPGVGRKTANVVLAHAFGMAAGIVVDTHVHRLAQRLGFSDERTPEKIELDLMEVFPRADWIDVGSILILHGRKTCKARKPECPACGLAAVCPSAEAILTGGPVPRKRS